MRYFRFLITLWSCSGVEGFRTMDGTENARPVQEKCKQTGEDPIVGAQVGRTLAAAI